MELKEEHNPIGMWVFVSYKKENIKWKSHIHYHENMGERIGNRSCISVFSCVLKNYILPTNILFYGRHISENREGLICIVGFSLFFMELNYFYGNNSENTE
ncbi:hypothetical protein CON65_13750 [Bacillus pseudomycoides]|uniref:Uncharacterized protein n=1 Tax=Bacillus pseudomycoides TaxID=64104 RepID=A0AA91VBD9_9BACI|nr:hypothetical protein [Bacillus sp. AFS014408]PEB56802.1 hypothetical protein COO03_00475 [Bacillus sp. AFS098217]PED82082.1 hypothetical protein CON65_13750 [Bacillus pseudomycoides]PEU06522.1 hypothetical protein CN524_22965 [Bacillus sp. AFS019443]PFW62836.1 hypothetical protein COL20_10945 [Bacillus sp. AFS075034]PEU18506.1 hypothetical protein CN525_11450 [Bacillus sp. AFS014408]